MALPPLLTLPQVAPVLGKSERTVQHWAQTDAFPVEIRTIAGRRYVRTVDLETYIGRPITAEDLGLVAA